VFGWQYSLGAALAWRGLGELDNAALGGVALPAYGYATLWGTVTAGVVLACVPFFAAVFVNLLATQWPDREADGTVGKDTLATRWPPATLRRLYLLGAAVAVGSPVPLAVAGVVPWPVAGATLLVAPLLAWGAVWYTRRRSPLPTVAAMVGMAVAQLAAWGHVAGVGPAYFASMLQ
jgi:1,4-dihydroxy-2-naphthoate octaprenyltransferase